MNSYYTVKYISPDLDELALELAYEQVKASELWNSLPSNAAIDAKAAELAKVIQESIETWFEKEREGGMKYDGDYPLATTRKIGPRHVATRV